MIYSSEYGILFNHVSRTGGSTISSVLRNQIGDAYALMGQHLPLVNAKKILNEQFESTFKFAFVRNPWDRFVSWYALIGKTIYGSDISPDKLHHPDFKFWNGFDSFLEQWGSDEITVDGLCRKALSQWGQLADNQGILLTDDIGRYETFGKDVLRIFNKIGINPINLPSINGSQHQHYSIYYSSFGRELVAELFHEDLEVFGYRFEELS